MGFAIMNINLLTALFQLINVSFACIQQGRSITEGRAFGRFRQSRGSKCSKISRLVPTIVASREIRPARIYNDSRQ
jgi:hypothetical protein